MALPAALLAAALLVVLGWKGGDPAVADDPDVSVAYGRADSVQLELSVESCNKDPRAEVQESATEVRIRAVVSQPMGQSEGDCMDSVRVTLRSPLGDRKVLDFEGKPIPVAPAET